MTFSLTSILLSIDLIVLGAVVAFSVARALSTFITVVSDEQQKVISEAMFCYPPIC